MVKLPAPYAERWMMKRKNKHMEKKIGKCWFNWGRKSGFGLGFEVSKYGWSIEFAFWYFGQEFAW